MLQDFVKSVAEGFTRNFGEVIGAGIAWGLGYMVVHNWKHIMHSLRKICGALRRVVKPVLLGLALYGAYSEYEFSVLKARQETNTLNKEVLASEDNSSVDTAQIEEAEEKQAAKPVQKDKTKQPAKTKKKQPAAPVHKPNPKPLHDNKRQDVKQAKIQQDQPKAQQDISVKPQASVIAHELLQPAKPKETKPAASGNKTAKIRYVVPPIAKPMILRIELADSAGKRNVLSKKVRTGEIISTTEKYSGECVITMYLGSEFVWQERQK